MTTQKIRKKIKQESVATPAAWPTFI